jgi:hypothetical protein
MGLTHDEIMAKARDAVVDSASYSGDEHDYIRQMDAALDRALELAEAWGNVNESPFREAYARYDGAVRAVIEA